MTNKLKRTTKKISGYFFLLLFLGFFSSNTFFDHAHIYNGEIIVHSHPYKHGEDGKPVHSHTTTGYVLVILLNNVIAKAVVSMALVSAMVLLTGELIFPKIISVRYSAGTSSVLLRGPPAFMLI